jgi:hypothetical protein
LFYPTSQKRDVGHPGLFGWAGDSGCGLTRQAQVGGDLLGEQRCDLFG